MNLTLKDIPTKLWLTKVDIAIGLVLSTFLINLLQLVFPIAILQVYDRVIPNDSYETLIVLCTIIISSLLLELVLRIGRSYVSSWAAARYAYNVGGYCFNKIKNADLLDFDKTSPGVYLERYNSVHAMKNYLCGKNLEIIIDFPFSCVYVILLGFINYYLLLIPLAMIGVLGISTYKSSKRSRDHFHKKQFSNQVKSKFLIEMFSGIHTIKALGMEEQILRRYERLQKQNIKNQYDFVKHVGESGRNYNFISQMGLILVASIGAILVINQKLSAGELAASILVSGRVMQAVTKLLSFYGNIDRFESLKEDLDSILTLKPEQEKTGKKLKDFKGNVELREVCFHHEGDDEHGLKSVSMKVSQGEMVALHGGGHSYKSTLLAIISGLIKPHSGQLLLDGEDSSDVDIYSIRENISLIQQEERIFKGTILENLTLFRNAEYGEKAKKMAHLLGLDRVINSMSKGYDTLIGATTIDMLSKGNEQQIFLIRSLVSSPKVILFDEANTAMDITTDNLLKQYLEQLKGQCTIIMVTHRPSLLKLADRHIMLDKGATSDHDWRPQW